MERAEDVESSSPLPPGWAEIKDQWRRYGLAEGMRQHSDADSATESWVSELEVRDDDRLTKRVLELERTVDIQAATVRQLVSRIDRLERDTAEQRLTERRLDARVDHVQHGPSVDRDAGIQPRRDRLDEAWSWLRAKRRHPH